jgi:hypothetical protein
MQTPCHLHLAAVRRIIRSDIFEGHLVVGCSFRLALYFTLSLIVMLIGSDVLILGGPSQVGACFLVIL